MARQTKKPAPVGSFGWVVNERALIRQHEEQDIEDFTFSARNDLEWLNEHMADIFERNQIDMAELLKTPGRLRGKTPGTSRKRAFPVQGSEPVGTIFDIKQPATIVDSPDNPFYDAIGRLPTSKEPPPARKPSKSPARSVQVLQDTQPKKLSDPMKDSAIHLSQAELEGSQPAIQIDSRINAGDSGIWSASSNPDLQQTQQPAVTSQRMSIVSENFNFASPGPDRDSAYRTAPEDGSDIPIRTKDTAQSSPPAPPPSDPRGFELLTEKSEKSEEPEKPEAVGQPEAKPHSFTDELKASERSESVASLGGAAPEPRRSGRLAERQSPSPSPPASTQLSECANDVMPPSSPPVVPRQDISAVDEEDAPTLPAAKSPSPSPIPIRSVRPETPTRSAESTTESPTKTPTRTPEGSPSKSSSEPPTPDVLAIRKSILSFAALPAREPLTSKKSLGMKTTRDSHVEQVRLNGANRASWMNRKGNGKSLGASSRQIERIEKQDEDLEQEEQARKSEVPLNRKRKSENIRDESQKRPKGSADKPSENADKPSENADKPSENADKMEDMEEGSSGEISEAMALHNKTSTQRLHDKIQQLGKLNASREARSFPSLVSQNMGLGYPELPQLDQEAQPMLKRTKSDPQGQLPHTANPTVRWTSQADDEEEWIPMKQEPKRQLTGSNTEGVVEPKQAIVTAPTAVYSTTTSESAPAFSLKSPTYPPKRHLPGSPLKSSFSDDWIKAPASPTRPPGEGTISAVKAHTTSVFKKAKEMLLKSSVSSASAKIETMGPGLRSWHGGNNLRQQMTSDAGRSQEPPKQHDQQLYPDLRSVDAEVQMPALAGAPTERPVAVEHVAEPIRESTTRSSRSRDTRDVTPGTEESAPKVYKKSNAAERAKRGEAIREREEKLRQAEEELRIVMEEERKEALEQAQEQQRRQKEEARKEKEESRRRQEVRLRQEKEELGRRQQEELRRNQEEARKQTESPFDFQDDEDYDISDKDEGSATDTRGRVTSSAEPERPPSRLQKGGSRFQKTVDKNKPLRPGTADKNPPKSKPGPVSISVGTASQREMQSQRSKPNMPTTSTLVAALKQSFELPGLQSSSSQISLSSSVSANSLRVSNPTGSKQLKSLTAAANQLKKEQEDKERKAVAKRDIERRRLENQRKLEEEARRARQKQAPTPTQKTLSRTQTVANLRQTSEEPERRPDFKGVNIKPTIVKAAVKRGFQPETTEDQQQYRQAPTKPGAPVYQQEGAKKRRTGEYDERPYEMAPPIRQSVAKKDIMPKSIMPHGYSSSQASSSSAGPSMLRLPTKPGAPMPQVEGVKFSKDKIRFANEATAGPPSVFKTPGAKSASKLAMLKTPAGVKDSPIYQSGELIELPDIPTDSEEDDDDDNYVPKDNFNVPQWAESPELRALLRQQQTVNPEEIFGPMAKLDMDAIFQNRTDKQAHKFRARTSSANWSGADRLTAAEIAADHEARQKMIAQGGWKYQAPS